MNWEDEGFVIGKRKFRENAIILDIFTNKFGKVSGIVYGGTSRKVRNHLQLMNKIFIIHTSKNENKIGYFKTELVKPISPEYFDDKNKILCLNSLSSILKTILPEKIALGGAMIDRIYNLTDRNAHNMARETLAKAMGNKKLLKAYEAINTLHTFFYDMNDLMDFHPCHK